MHELNGTAGDVSVISSIVHETNVSTAALDTALAGSRVSSPMNVHGTSAPDSPPENATTATAVTTNLILNATI